MAPSYASHSDGDDSTIRIRGELDVTMCDDLAEVLDAFIGARHRIVVDMSEVTDFDDPSLEVMLAARDRAIAEAGSLHIRNPAPVVREALEAAGTIDLVEPAAP